MPDKVAVSKERLDSLADVIGAKSERGVPLTFDAMEDAVLGIEAGIQPSGTLAISRNGTHDVAGYASARVNVKPKLQGKTVHPTTETQYVEADSGYDGLDEVVVDAMDLGERSVTPSMEQQVVTAAKHIIASIPTSSIGRTIEADSTLRFGPDGFYKKDTRVILDGTLGISGFDNAGGAYGEMTYLFSGDFSSINVYTLNVAKDSSNLIDESKFVKFGSFGVYVGADGYGNFYPQVNASRYGWDAYSKFTLTSADLNVFEPDRDALSQVTVEPIPSNYGLITYDGSVITVS